MANNMSLWDQVKVTDPDMTEKINFGAYKFTTIDAQYQVMKATEAFGPCGIGWGLKDQRVEVITAHPAEPYYNLLCFTATLWYTWGDQAGALEIAADIELFEYSAKNSKWNRVGDPVKKVRTAALSKGLSWLGFSADVFLGKFDDARYVNQLKQDKQAGRLGPVQTPVDAGGGPAGQPPAAKKAKATDPLMDLKKQVNAERLRLGWDVAALNDFSLADLDTPLSELNAEGMELMLKDMRELESGAPLDSPLGKQLAAEYAATQAGG